jgi:hypothetical protein
MMREETVVRVHETWDGFRTADVRFGDLRDVHWLQPGHAPHRIIHGYVSCAGLAGSHLSHDCDRRTAPHRLLVCVLKRHATESSYSELVRRADAHAAAAMAVHSPDLQRR